MEQRSNILVVAITRMGDMLQASPTLVGLKKKYPRAKVTVLIEKQFASICEGIPGIDEIYSLDLSLVVQSLNRDQESIVDAYRYFEEVLTELKGRKFDMAINMSSSAYTAILLRLLNVGDNRGWTSDDEGFRLIENPWAMLFAAFVYHSNRDYNSINLVDILRCSSGVSTHPHRLVYNVPEKEKNFPEKFLQSKNVIKGRGPVIALQAGASQAKRQWAPEKFAHLVRLLIESLDATVILTGAKSELPIIEAILQNFRHAQLVSAAGETNLGQLGAILEFADIMVTGDTGPMHLAVAVETPVIALFLASALCFETGPYSEGNIVLQPQIHCNPCNPNLPCSRTDCHTQVAPELVFKLVEMRLKCTTAEVSKLVIPSELANPLDVAIYGTVFDSDGFLDFKPLNGSAGRKGFTNVYYEAARESYRKVWKSEFGSELMIEKLAVERKDLTPLNEVESALSVIIGLCDRGRSQLLKLEKFISDTSATAKQLGEANSEVIKTDRLLEDIGLSHGVVGALVRMFIMERENIRGENPLDLTEATRGLYDNLERRSRLFWQFYRGNSKGQSLTI